MTLSKLSRPAAILLALFVVFLWATSWVLIKIGLEEIPPLTFAGLRYVIGFLLLLPVFALRQGLGTLRGLSRRSWIKLLVLGLLFYAVTQGASFVALAVLPAITVNLLWSFSAVFVALLGISILQEHLTAIQWTGILLSIIGAVVYFYPVSFPANFIVGLIAAVIGVAANAIASILGRDINRMGKLDPLTVTVVSMGIGSVALLITGISTGGLPPLSLQSWAIIGWLALVNTAFAFTLWNRTLQTLQATESSVINGTMMIWIPILAVLFLDEQLYLKEIVGLIAAGVGALIVQVGDPIKRFQRSKN
jgi:drug/metabolite transporter (DMT)-like permease